MQSCYAIRLRSILHCELYIVSHQREAPWYNAISIIIPRFIISNSNVAQETPNP
jgi:hypothetical protein